ncbi:sensor histidine kinase [Gemmiger sp.]
MKHRKHTIYTAVIAVSAAMAAAGSFLACRTFGDRLARLETEAVLQHQWVVCGLESAVAAEMASARSGGYYDRETVCARVGAQYTRGQQVVLGSRTPSFALLNDDNVEYSTVDLPAEILQQAAADGENILLRDRQLLLAGDVYMSGKTAVTAVTAVDASDAYAARDKLLFSWLAVQAFVTLAALAAGHSYTKEKELNDRQSRFVADLTHELKTPLTSMIGYADLLRSGELDDTRRRTAADAIYHESARLESLSRQLLALQGLQTDGIALENVRVAAVFADAARSLPEVTIDADAPAGAAVRAERVLLGDLLRNLVLNAWHAAPKDGTVHLRCEDVGTFWRLTVRDTGCGIPPEALPHLTEAFYRVDKARARADGGSGVGLALCAEIAAAFGTKLEFESTPDVGTTVSILLRKGDADHEETEH